MWKKKKAPEPPLASTLGTPSDLPTEAVPSQPAATSSGVSNAAGGPGGGQSLAQIGKSLKLKGEITGNEDLYIDGEVEGTVELSAVRGKLRQRTVSLYRSISYGLFCQGTI